MKTIFGASDGIRTVVFPDMVNTIRQGAFNKIGSLRSAVLNEGLKALGTDEYKSDGKGYLGVFQESGLRRVRLPSTLKKIEYKVFAACKCLECVGLPEKLEHIGKWCFSDSGLESISLPDTLKTIEDGTF